MLTGFNLKEPRFAYLETFSLRRFHICSLNMCESSQPLIILFFPLRGITFVFFNINKVLVSGFSLRGQNTVAFNQSLN